MNLHIITVMLKERPRRITEQLLRKIQRPDLLVVVGIPLTLLCTSTVTRRLLQQALQRRLPTTREHRFAEAQVESILRLRQFLVHLLEPLFHQIQVLLQITYLQKLCTDQHLLLRLKPLKTQTVNLQLRHLLRLQLLR
jgi:hypothetical protein